MTKIEESLRASVATSAHHGNELERYRCGTQMLEAADEIERMRRSLQLQGAVHSAIESAEEITRLGAALRNSEDEINRLRRSAVKENARKAARFVDRCYHGIALDEECSRCLGARFVREPQE